MAIPESQLETWSHQGAVTTSKNTYASIKASVEARGTLYVDKSFYVFLQGSYGNDTNVRADSDVDVITMLTDIWRADLSQLPQDQADAYRRTYSDATYQLSDFKNGVVDQLQSTYGYANVQVGNKSVKLASSSNRLGADIVVCHQYRYYRYFFGDRNQSFDEGILFRTSAGTEIINYPKLHSANCSVKHQSTGQMFKPMVRILKNMRGRLVADRSIASDLAPSYFIEGLLYNVPDEQFTRDFGGTFCNYINWLIYVDCSKFVCPNGKHLLFGSSSVQWDKTKCGQFQDALVNLWNRW